jgi:protein-S-isoprenylcysteine O-methyltransferase Ste14
VAMENEQRHSCPTMEVVAQGDFENRLSAADADSSQSVRLIRHWAVCHRGAERGRDGEGVAIGHIAGFMLLRRRTVPFFDGAILWRYTPSLGVIADLVTLAGLLVAHWARTTLGGNWSSNVVIKEDHELIERGPYRYVRHPIYSSIILMVLGTVILWGRATALILVVGSAVVLWVKLRKEERVLARHFPEAYSLRAVSTSVRVCRERSVNAAGESPVQGGVGRPW